jgi:hypothetical protein
LREPLNPPPFIPKGSGPSPQITVSGSFLCTCFLSARDRNLCSLPLPHPRAARAGRHWHRWIWRRGCAPGSFIRARPTLANNTVCPAESSQSTHASKHQGGASSIASREMNALLSKAFDSARSSLSCFHCSRSSYFPSPMHFSPVASPFCQLRLLTPLQETTSNCETTTHDDMEPERLHG